MPDSTGSPSSRPLIEEISPRELPGLEEHTGTRLTPSGRIDSNPLIADSDQGPISSVTPRSQASNEPLEPIIINDPKEKAQLQQKRRELGKRAELQRRIAELASLERAGRDAIEAVLPLDPEPKKRLLLVPDASSNNSANIANDRTQPSLQSPVQLKPETPINVKIVAPISKPEVIEGDSFYLHLHRVAPAINAAQMKGIDDPQEAYEALSQDGENYTFLSNRLKRDFIVAAMAIEKSVLVWLYFPDELKEDQKLIEIALRNEKSIIEFFQNNPVNSPSRLKLSLKILALKPQYINLIPTHLQENRDFLLEFFQLTPPTQSDLAYFSLAYFSSDFRSISDIAAIALVKNPNNLRLIDQNILTGDFVSNVLNQHCHLLPAFMNHPSTSAIARSIALREKHLLLRIINQFPEIINFLNTDPEFARKIKRISMSSEVRMSPEVTRLLAPELERYSLTPPAPNTDTAPVPATTPANTSLDNAEAAPALSVPPNLTQPAKPMPPNYARPRLTQPFGTPNTTAEEPKSLLDQIAHSLRGAFQNMFKTKN